MQYTTIASAALVALPFASAGKANIYNKCDFDVTAWSVTSVPQSVGDAIHIKAGSSYSEEYKQVASGGVSLKIVNTTEATVPPQAHIMQFEYTDASGNIWYDISNVDCSGDSCPFARYGWYMDSSDASCPTRSCEADAEACTGAYLVWNDDINTLACGNSQDISLYLCESQKPSGDDSTEAPPADSYEAPTQNQVQSENVAAPQESAPAPAVESPAPVAQEAPAPVADAPVTVVTEIVYKTLVGSVLTSDMFDKREEQAPAQRRHAHHARHLRSRPMM